MPRNRPGGLRNGAPGAAYGNRTDLNRPSPIPIKAAPHQTYGAVTAQMQAQRAVPMAKPPMPQPQPASALPQGAASVPGSLGDLHRPTERPQEPVTAGAALGPGPGPEAMPGGPTSPNNSNLSQMLGDLAAKTGNPALQALAQHAAANGL